MTVDSISADVAATLPAGSAPRESQRYDVCVVGGGLAGLCAALSAARSGAKTVLVQDRAVLGGNASSEIRMWALGAHGADARESGIMEEIRLANLRYNGERRFSVWDGVLYGLAREQEGLDLLLSCAICAVHCREGDAPEGRRPIESVEAWHLTRQRWIDIEATAFIDCSGDSILRLSGAPTRWGRESVEVSGEPHARPAGQADRKTMGNTILMQLREIDATAHRPYVPPAWALEVTEETFPHRKLKPTGHNFWWLELGGLLDTIDDADRLRDDLVALAHGVWAFIKNHPDGRGHGWELEWIGALPGKRENIRYEGDHILSEDDILAEGRFDDLVAHGGWTMDDHFPEGIWAETRDGTTHHKAPSPYGIPYRSLYSRAVPNLWFAGRNISATHMAMSSTRVMATCATMGQAAGTAAAIAVAAGCDNRAVHEHHLDCLQRRLMDQDQWLPARQRPIPELTAAASLSASTGDPELLRSGIDRRTNGAAERWDGGAGDWVQFSWAEPQSIDRLRATGDSKLSMLKTMPCSFPQAGNRQELPATLPRDLRIDISDDGENWTPIHHISDNYRRLIEWKPEHPITARHLRLTCERSWGDAPSGFFALEVGTPSPTGPITPSPWPKSVSAKGGSA